MRSMDIIIETGKLRQKPERMRAEMPSAVLEMDSGDLVRADGPLRYDLTVQRAFNELVVRGTLSVNFKCLCARCGVCFIKKVFIGDFCRSFALKSKSELINLTPDVREDILLALPMVAVCSNACRGLCAGCGVNLNSGKCKCVRKIETDKWQILDGLRLR